MGDTQQFDIWMTKLGGFVFEAAKSVLVEIVKCQAFAQLP
jgi:hypothetical protein